MRERGTFVALALGTIAVGLLVHSRGTMLPASLRDMLGDALWAMMIVWWLGVAAPRLPVRRRALAAFAICVAVELSQRYHTASLDAFRRTVIGQLTIGSGYDPRDFISYAAGILVAVAIDMIPA